MKRLALGLIQLYRFLASPWVGNHCRFYPSCSHYAEEAIQHYGFFRGGWLTLKRLGRCHPWHPGGVDLVPGPQHGRIPVSNDHSTPTQ